MKDHPRMTQAKDKSPTPQKSYGVKDHPRMMQEKERSQPAGKPCLKDHPDMAK